MNFRFSTVAITVLLLSLCSNTYSDTQLGPRPDYLVNSMEDGALKDQLQSCAGGDFEPSKFSIGHRGAPRLFPEHTKESYIAAARMGAAILECDVTFTKDRELVCRHSQCDLHTTTNILAIPELAKKCSVPFSPAKINRFTGAVSKEAMAKCCTSDISVEEFLSLKGIVDASNPNAKSVEEYLSRDAPTSKDVDNFLGAKEHFLSDVYTEQGTLMTHAQSIELFKSLNVGMTPELKSADVPMPYNGDYTQQDYAKQLVDEYENAGVNAKDVWLQSFNLEDVLYWIENTPLWGEQSVYLDGRYSSQSFNPSKERSWKPSMVELKEKGVNIIAPPLWVLLQQSGNGSIVPSVYAEKAKEQNLDIITWSLERSGSLNTGGGWYYKSVKGAINKDGDMITALDVLAKDVGVMGVFSDWPAIVTYYANCVGMP